jgi:hypothetical protein
VATTKNGSQAAALKALAKHADTERNAYDAKVDAIVKLHRAGVGISELADAAGMSTAGVRRIVMLAGTK